MAKPFRELNVCDDYMFTAVLSNEKICIAILEKILNIEIESLIYLEPQKSLNANRDSKSIRLDVYIKDHRGQSYNIKMQTTNNDDLLKRARYYQGMMDRDCLDKGTKVKYETLNKSYIIFICTFDPFKKGHYMYQFERVCTSDSNVKETDDTIHLFLNTRGKTDDVDHEMKLLLNYIEHSTNETAMKSNSELVHEINDVVQSIKNSERERENYMTLADRLDEEFQAGKKQEKIEMAKRLLNMGMDIDNIITVTQLDKEVIEKLNK